MACIIIANDKYMYMPWSTKRA